MPCDDQTLRKTPGVENKIQQSASDLPHPLFAFTLIHNDPYVEWKRTISERRGSGSIGIREQTGKNDAADLIHDIFS